MRNEFEKLIESKPACVQDIVRELRKHDESITFLDAIGDSVPEVKDVDRKLSRRKCNVTGTMPLFRGHGSSAQRAKGSTILCSLQPKQLRCLPPI